MWSSSFPCGGRRSPRRRRSWRTIELRVRGKLVAELNFLGAVEHVGDNRDVENFLENGAVADACAVAFILYVVENEPFTLKSPGLDGADGEDRLVEGAKPVVDDNEDRKLEPDGEVGECFLLCEGRFPSAGALDEDVLVLGAEGFP